MSWDKNTVNMSGLDAIKETLDNLGTEYTLTAEAEVRGNGMNDSSGDPPYKLRRLQYGDWVVLERIVKDADCDTDDIIYSQTFLLKKEPKDWQYVVQTDVFGDS